jgi:hypothetical protein
MSTQVPLRCQCGRVRGVALDVSPETVNRVFCYCDDCQAFARFLERPETMDAWGGTDISQHAPARVQITEGAEALRSMRLSPKGLLRWHTECCRTPVANTLSARAPFTGIIHSFMDHAGDGRSRDTVLGEPVAYIHGRFAVATPPPHVHPKVPLRPFVRCARVMLGWWISGRGRPSPFFDPRTGAPTVTPSVLRRSEREALQSQVGAA